MPVPDNISESESDTDDIGEKNIARISRALVKEGYKEGISAGHDSVFQNSFDKGYEEGLTNSFDYYVLKEILQNFKNYETTLPPEVVDCLKHLNISTFEDVLKPQAQGEMSQNVKLIEVMKTIKTFFS